MELISGIRRYSGLQFGNTIYATDINSSIMEHKEAPIKRVEASHSRRISDIVYNLPVFAYAYSYSTHTHPYEDYSPLWTFKDGKRLKELELVKEYAETEHSKGKFENYIDELLVNLLKIYVKDQNVDNLSLTLRFNILTSFIAPDFINECLWSDRYSKADLDKVQQIIIRFKPKIETKDDLRYLFDMVQMPVEWASKILV